MVSRRNSKQIKSLDFYLNCKSIGGLLLVICRSIKLDSTLFCLTKNSKNILPRGIAIKA